MKIPDKLLDKTFVIEHNPNCLSPFLVRLVSVGQGRICDTPERKSEDTVGYGKTLEQAATEALFVKWIDEVRAESEDEGM